MERAENAMIRWMCGVTLRDKCAMKGLRERLGIVSVMDVVRRGRLAWFGHFWRERIHLNVLMIVKTRRLLVAEAKIDPRKHGRTALMLIWQGLV